jgi:NO-binding membrane sensor protein with MHYT domain
MVSVHNFSYGLFNPAVGYLVSCLGAFLGLRCVTRSWSYTGARRAPWLVLAAVSIGATGVWAMHFIAMLGFTIPSQTILYNVPLTIESMLLAILVVGSGLFIVGYRGSGWAPVLTGGVIIGLGVASMHYIGMAAMEMSDSVQYNLPLVVVSVVIAVVAGTAALWAGTRVRGNLATIGASLIMGVAVSGMHYTGMAAMRVYPGPMMAMSGSTALSFVVPLILGLSLVTFLLALLIALSPSPEELAADAAIQRRIDAEIAAGRFTRPAQPERRAGRALWGGGHRPPR